MERRTFLKVSLVTVAALAARLASPWAASAAPGDVAHGGLLYRTGGAGKILSSADRGKSWRLHSDLGDMYSISNIGVDRRSKLLQLTVGYAGYPFALVLAADERSWLTA